MKKVNIHYLITLIVGALLVATIVVSLKAGSKGDKLVFLDEEARSLQSENQDIKDSLVAATSLTRIAKVASSSGMIAPENFIYISSSSVATRGINQVASLP